MVTLLLITVLFVSLITVVADSAGVTAYGSISFRDAIALFTPSGAEDADTTSDEDDTAEDGAVQGEVAGITSTSVGSFPPVTYPAFAPSAFASDGGSAEDETADGENGFGLNLDGAFDVTGSLDGQYGNTVPGTEPSNPADTGATDGSVAGATNGQAGPGIGSAGGGVGASAGPAIVVPEVTRVSPVPAKVGDAVDIYGDGFDSINTALFVGNGISVEMKASAGIPSWTTVFPPKDMPVGVYTVTITNRTATSAPFTVELVQ